MRGSTLSKAGPEELDHVHLDALDGQIVQQTAQQIVRLSEVLVGGVDQVDAEDAQRLLLSPVLAIEHPHVRQDLTGLGAGCRLEADAHPAVAFVVALVAAGTHRVGEGEELRGVTPFGQSLDQQVVLVAQHRLQPLARDVARRLAVDRVADRHVVRRDRFRDAAGGGARLEEPPHHLLPRPDLGERAVAVRIEVQLECLSKRADFLRALVAHGSPPGCWRTPIVARRARSVGHVFGPPEDTGGAERPSGPCGSDDVGHRLRDRIARAVIGASRPVDVVPDHDGCASPVVRVTYCPP